MIKDSWIIVFSKKYYDRIAWMMISYCDIQRDSRNDPRSQGICPGRSVVKGSGARCIPAPMYVRWRRCPSRSVTPDYKISFLPGECLRISNKAVILFSLQRTTRPCRGVGFFSFFVYSPANWFCGIHAPFPLPRPNSLLVHLFQVLILVHRAVSWSREGTAISGYANTRSAWTRDTWTVGTRGEKPAPLSSTKIILDILKTG